MDTSEIKETTAQRAERLKLRKNAWECLGEIREFARLGYESIPPEWLSTYFRPWGVYTQGDGNGVTGGKGGEGRATQFFMVRIRIPNGLLRSEQLRAIADLTEKHARGVADITTRQNVQLHWVTIESLPDILEKLRQVGLSTTGTCGDDARNITGCPLAGLDVDEYFDASPLALEINRALAGAPEFYNLPRKFKVSITGCRVWCSYPEINDVALTATPRRRNGTTEIGFSIRVGGGLSTEPFLATRLNAFISREQVVPVVHSVAEIFRDSTVLRQNRKQARLKYLFLKHGWTADTFLVELERRLGFRLDPTESEDAPADVYRDHVGIHAQKQPGYSCVGASVLRGRMTHQQLRTAANLAQRFAGGELRTTIMQNLVLVNVKTENTEVLAAELESTGLPVAGSSFARGAIACTGSEFCKLALTETKGFARWLVNELEERLPAFDEQIKLHITGCPNSCGQHWIADVGIEGKKIKVNGQMIDAYYFCIGGAVGQFQAIARPVGHRCAAAEVPDAIERLLKRFQENRGPGENLREFFARHNNDEIRAILAGGISESVARDVFAGPVPPGVEG